MSTDAVGALNRANEYLDRIAELMPNPFVIDASALPELVRALGLAADELAMAERADPLVSVTHDVEGEERELDVCTTRSALLAYDGMVTGFGTGDKVRGASLLKQALALVPESFANGHFALAILYAETNRNADALQHIQLALELDPENEEYREILGLIEDRSEMAGSADHTDSGSAGHQGMSDAPPAQESESARSSFADFLAPPPPFEAQMTGALDPDGHVDADGDIWRLTSRVRSVVWRVQRDVFDRAERAIAEADKRVGAAQASKEASVSAAEGLVRALRTEAAGLINSARQHVKGQGILIHASISISMAKGYLSASSLDPAEIVSEVDALVAAMRPVVSSMLSIGKPKAFWRPDSDGVWAMLGIGSLIAGNVISGLLPGGFFLPALGTYALVMWRLHQDPSGKLQWMLGQIAGNADRVRGLAERHVEGVSRRAQEHYANTLQEITSELASIDKQLAAAYANLIHEAATLQTDSAFAGAAWEDEVWTNWAPATDAAFAARIGTLSAEIPVGYGRLLPSLVGSISVPALVPFPEGQCLLVQASGADKRAAAGASQSAVARLLATIPPAKLRLTFIDPVALGSNIAAFMPLADHEDSLVTSRAWSEPQHIEQRLADLTEHMETVIQKYLRADYKTIYDYNDAAKEVAEPYRLLVVFDFPVNFSDTAARRLVSIARNGPRCGVYTFIVRDTDKPLPYGFSMSDLEAAAARIETHPLGTKKGLQWNDPDFGKWDLALDAQAPALTLSKVIAAVGARAKDAMRVEVPYDKLLSLASIDADSWWRSSTAHGIRVPLGPTGARKLQHLVFGEGMSHHALIVGRPGSGKSNLMHVIIMTLALTYSPSEIQLYLIDFKKGVEFKPYADARLPHAYAIAVESEREYGLSLIAGLDKELERRGKLFGPAGATNISQFREKQPEVQMPRVVLMVDEFQEFFSDDDSIARQTALILDRLVRQGRAFGIHVVLGSQTLAGSNSLAGSTLDQMAVRIAMQCSETDSRLILADDNPGARLLARPGEAIYNDAAGLIEGNSLFQVAHFSEEDRVAKLAIIADLGRGSGNSMPVPRIFEGNELALLASSPKMRELMDNKDWPTNRTIDLYLGDPIALRDPIAARVRRQSGSHLLILSRDEEEGVGMCMAAILSIIGQAPPKFASLIIADFTLAESRWAEHAEDIERFFPHKPRVLSRQREVAIEVRRLAAEVKTRSAGEASEDSFATAVRSAQGSVFLILQGLHRMKALRTEDGGFEYDDDATMPSDHLATILRDGPEVGIHVIAWCDTWSNAVRAIENRVMSNFGLRVGGAMSADESQKVFDDSAASRISKPHRVLFFDDERPGQLEKFRPYAMPPKEWLAEVGDKLSSRVAL